MPRLRVESMRVTTRESAGRHARLECCRRCGEPASALFLDQPSAGQPFAWICQACRRADWEANERR